MKKITIKSKKFWLKTVATNKEKFCLIECSKNKEGIIHPEKNKTKLNTNDIIIGNYWFDGDSWCFSIFPHYQYLFV